MVTLLNGNFLLAYAKKLEKDNFQILAQQYDVNGVPAGGRIEFKFDNQIRQPVFDIDVEPNGDVVVVAESDNGINGSDVIGVGVGVIELLNFVDLGVERGGNDGSDQDRRPARR